MRIFAFADEACPYIDGQIKAMQENGVAGLEIRGVDKVNVADISDAKAREVRAKLDAAGLVTWSIGSPIGKIDIEKDSFETHLEKFKRTLEIADILGAENIRLFSFFPPKDKNPEDYRDKVIERLSAFCEAAEGYGITLCHENEKGIYGDTADRCLEIHRALPELKCIFDPANFVQCGQDTLKAWKQLRPYVEYLHIKDALADGNVVPAGKGIGNLAAILDDFAAMGGNAVTLEPHLKVFDGLAALEKEDDKSVVGEVYSYPSNEEAFAAAADALKALL